MPRKGNRILLIFRNNSHFVQKSEKQISFLICVLSMCVMRIATLRGVTVLVTVRSIDAQHKLSSWNTDHQRSGSQQQGSNIRTIANHEITAIIQSVNHRMR